jgi:hypothetical protein
MYLTVGAELGFDKKGENLKLIKNSLQDGYPEDKEDMSILVNSSRAGSYSRGSETQKGGITAKNMTRASSSIEIASGDCGTKIGKELYITEDIKNVLLNRNIIQNGKLVNVTDVDKYINKKVIIRSPIYCLYENVLVVN